MDSEANLKEFARRLEQRVDRRHKRLLRRQRWLIQAGEVALVLGIVFLAVLMAAAVILFLL